MSPGWHAHVASCRLAVVQDRRAMVLGWTIFALLTALVCAALGAKLATVPWRGILGGLTVPAMILAGFYWFRFVPGAVRQNSPANARLTPKLHAAVRRVAVVMWFLCLVPIVLLCFAGSLPPSTFFYLAFMMTLLGVSRGGVQAGAALYMVFVVACIALRRSGPLMELLDSPAGIATAAALCLGAAALALHIVFPAGGERHFKLLKPQRQHQVGTTLGALQNLKRKSGGRTRFYSRLLQYDLRRARRDHLLLHALGPAKHRFDFLAPMLGAVALAVLARASMWMLALPLNETIGHVVTIMVTLVLLAQGVLFERIVASATNTAGEQSLLRMAPAAPSAVQLGRVVARQLFAICVREWLVLNVLAAALVLLFGGGVAHLMVLASTACATFALTGWALRDYTGSTEKTPADTMFQVMLMGAGAGAVALFFVRDNLLLWVALQVYVLGAAGAIVWSRWQRMVNAPTPFPAGRFA